MPPKYHPSQGIEWTAETLSSAMLEIVSNRQKHFRDQRAYGQNAAAAKASKTILDNLGAEYQPLKSHVRQYEDFCAVLDVAALPITSTMIALFLFAKCSRRNGYYETTMHYLGRAAKATRAAWCAAVDFDSEQYVRQQKLADRAIAEFRAERARNRVKASSDTKRRPSNGTSPATPAYVSDTSDNESPLGVEPSEHETSVQANEPESDLDFSADEGDPLANDRLPIESTPGASSGLLPPCGSAGAVEQIPTPDLPRPGDTFVDYESLLSATYRALLPAYAMGVRSNGYGNSPLFCARSHTLYRDTDTGVCNWTLGFTINPRTNERVVDAATSNLYHNHGPHPKLLKDPSYRPIIKNERVRRDLGMPSLRPRALASGVPSSSISTAASASSRSNSTPATLNESPSHPNKKLRLASPAASSEASNRTEYFAIPSHPRSTSSPRTRVDLPRPPSLSTPVAPASFFGGPSLSLSSISDPRHDHLETQQHGLSTVSAPSTPLVSLASTARHPEPFDSLLVAFFASFDLALTPLAKRFVDGGWITSRDDLVAFCAFDETTRRNIYDAMLGEAGEDGRESIGRGELSASLDWLEESVQRAQASGWKT
ncbi:hypothetical protein JCM10212_003632 [Sporobolomyces blumeae]